jgi:hypothetical protein
MSNTWFPTRQSARTDDDHSPIVQLLLRIRRSFLLFVATVGVLLIVLGGTLFGGTGVLAAMFAIWGVSAILYALGGVLLMRLIGYR